MVTSDCTSPNTERPRTPRPWEKAFLTALAATGNVSAACRNAEITTRNVYYARANWPDFREAFEDAYEAAADLLEAEARRRAYHGVDEPVIHRGKVCMTWVDAEGKPVPDGTEGASQVPLTLKKYSDPMLMFLLKAARPAKYRESFRFEHSNANLDAEITEQLARLAGPGHVGAPQEAADLLNVGELCRVSEARSHAIDKSETSTPSPFPV